MWILALSQIWIYRICLYSSQADIRITSNTKWDDPLYTIAYCILLAYGLLVAVPSIIYLLYLYFVKAESNYRENPQAVYVHKVFNKICYFATYISIITVMGLNLSCKYRLSCRFGRLRDIFRQIDLSPEPISFSLSSIVTACSILGVFIFRAGSSVCCISLYQISLLDHEKQEKAHSEAIASTNIHYPLHRNPYHQQNYLGDSSKRGDKDQR